MKKVLVLGLLGLALLLPGMSWSLSISPSTIPQWTGSETGVPQIFQEIYDDYGITIGTSNELFKQDVGAPESGIAAPFYTASINSSGGTIVWDGPGQIWPTNPLYLLVKDGKAVPSWYLYNLMNISGQDPWNGKETIILSGFWPTQGGISHVSLYGSASVPEPFTMLLLGLGLVGLAGVGRKLKK